MADEPVSLAEAAEITGLSIKAIRERIYRGTLTARKDGGRYRVKVADLEKVMRKHGAVTMREVTERLEELERRVARLERELVLGKR
jgi:excisionase family DNA binding protein